MQKIKNANGKLVCEVDKIHKIVEIVHKEFKTTVRFLADDRIEVVNTKTI